MQNYLNLLLDVKENGIQSMDRTGTGTLSVFGRQMRFDLAKGFPIMTTKKVHWRSVVYELLWFIKGDTNIGYLHDHKVTIWDEWADENGDLGPIYGCAWRQAPAVYPGHLKQIRIRKDTYASYKPKTPVFYEPINCDLNTQNLWAIGVIETSPNTVYWVQCKSGYIFNLSRPNWRRMNQSTNNKYDKYHPDIYGVGYIGDLDGVYHDSYMYNTWYNMLARCYNKTHPQYHLYGGQGVTVSPIWYSYEMFCRTLPQVEGYAYWKQHIKHYDLDKDYYGSNVYSPNTCIFLPKSINTGWLKNSSCVCICGHKYMSLGDFCQVNGISYKNLSYHLNNGNSYAGISKEDIEVIHPDKGYVYRPEVYIDQLKNLLDNIKKEPYSRRLIISAYIPSLLGMQALPPCHAFFQFYIRNNKLSCQLYQR